TMESRLRVSMVGPEQGRAMVTWGQIRTNWHTFLGRPGPEDASAALINLNRLQSSAPLSEVIRLYATSEENAFVAEKLFQYIQQVTVSPEDGSRRVLGRVGALLGAKVDTAEVAANPRLPSLAKRAEETTGDAMPLLTRNDLNALRRFFIVKTAAES